MRRGILVQQTWRCKRQSVNVCVGEKEGDAKGVEKRERERESKGSRGSERKRERARAQKKEREREKRDRIVRQGCICADMVV